MGLIRGIKMKRIVEPLIEWYELNKRDLPWRHDPTPYRVWISEIMLQQTRVDPVIPYYLRFLEEVPDVQTLAALPEDQLMKLWEGLGYYSRARNLQKAAKQIVDAGAFPTDFSGWLALSGIGEYTAGAICSIALGLPTPAVDGNVLRVLSRLLGSFADIASPAVKKEFTASLATIYPQDKTSEFTQSLMELGATVCLPNGEPHCEVCPLAHLCAAKEKGLIGEIPVKASKKARKIEEKTVLILRCGNQIALKRRPSRGLLANLWEYPNLPGKYSKEQLLEQFKDKGVSSVIALQDSTHIFSHIEWHMSGYSLVLKEKPADYSWFLIQEILDQKAIPAAFRCYTDYLKNLRYEVQE